MNTLEPSISYVLDRERFPLFHNALVCVLKFSCYDSPSFFDVDYCMCTYPTARRIAAAVNVALRPVLNEMKEEVKSEITNLSNKVGHFAEELGDHKRETAPVLVHMESTLQSVVSNSLTEALSTGVLEALLNNTGDVITTEVGELVRSTYTDISERVSDLREQLRNSSVRDDLNCVKTELSRVSGIISDLGEDLQTHSQQTLSSVAQLHTRLSSKR